jgi:hypothetical protein
MYKTTDNPLNVRRINIFLYHNYLILLYIHQQEYQNSYSNIHDSSSRKLRITKEVLQFMRKAHFWHFLSFYGHPQGVNHQVKR